MKQNQQPGKELGDIKKNVHKYTTELKRQVNLLLHRPVPSMQRLYDLEGSL